VDLLDLHRAAIDDHRALLARLRPADFDLATPCAGWTVRDLLRHQVEVALDYDARARDGQRRPWPDDDPVVAYSMANDLVVAAFRADGFLDRGAEFLNFGTQPGRVLVGAHFIDNLVHSWDVRRALGVDSALDDDLAHAAYRVAARYPTTPDVRGPGAPFGPPVAVAEDAPITDRLVALLGRSPDWRA